jgi:SulP family sulfate permease
MASFWFMKQMSDVTEESAKGSVHVKTVELPDEKDLNDEVKKHIYIQHFDGPIFFGFTFGFGEIMRKMPEVDKVIFRMENVPYIDQSGLYAIEDAMMELHKKGIKIYISAINTQPKDMMKKIQLIPNLILEDNIYQNFDELKSDLKIC